MRKLTLLASAAAACSAWVVAGQNAPTNDRDPSAAAPPPPARAPATAPAAAPAPPRSADVIPQDVMNDAMRKLEERTRQRQQEATTRPALAAGASNNAASAGGAASDPSVTPTDPEGMRREIMRLRRVASALRRENESLRAQAIQLAGNNEQVRRQLEDSRAASERAINERLPAAGGAVASGGDDDGFYRDDYYYDAWGQRFMLSGGALVPVRAGAAAVPQSTAGPRNPVAPRDDRGNVGQAPTRRDPREDRGNIGTPPAGRGDATGGNQGGADRPGSVRSDDTTNGGVRAPRREPVSPNSNKPAAGRGEGNRSGGGGDGGNAAGGGNENK